MKNYTEFRDARWETAKWLSELENEFNDMWRHTTRQELLDALHRARGLIDRLLESYEGEKPKSNEKVSNV